MKRAGNLYEHIIEPENACPHDHDRYRDSALAILAAAAALLVRAALPRSCRKGWSRTEWGKLRSSSNRQTWSAMNGANGNHANHGDARPPWEHSPLLRIWRATLRRGRLQSNGPTVPVRVDACLPWEQSPLLRIWRATLRRGRRDLGRDKARPSMGESTVVSSLAGRGSVSAVIATIWHHGCSLVAADHRGSAYKGGTLTIFNSQHIRIGLPI